MGIILCSLTIYAKFGGQSDCTCIAWQGWQSTISTGQVGRLENLHGRCEFVGGGVQGLLPLENFEMWRLGNGIFNILNDIFLWKKLNLDKVLNKNIFPLEKLPSPKQPPRLCRPCMGMDNREWHILRGTQRLFSVKHLFGEPNIAQNFLLLEDG